MLTSLETQKDPDDSRLGQEDTRHDPDDIQQEQYDAREWQENIGQELTSIEHELDDMRHRLDVLEAKENARRDKVGSPELQGVWSAREEDAIRRQIALTFEMECKLFFVAALQNQDRVKFIVDERMYLVSPLEDLSIRKLEAQLKKVYPQTCHKLATRIFSKNRRTFYMTLFHLKKYSGPPMDLDRGTLTVHTARDLIATMTLRTSRPVDPTIPREKDNIASIQAEAHRMLSLLSDMRKTKAHLLEHFFEDEEY